MRPGRGGFICALGALQVHSRTLDTLYSAHLKSHSNPARRVRPGALAMHISIQRQRIRLERGVWVSPDQIASLAKKRSHWPRRPVYLEWRDGSFEELHNDLELEFAARLVSEFHADTVDRSVLSTMDETAAMEAKCARHMQEESDSDPDEVREEDDITTEDLVAWGYRAVLETNE